MTELVGRTSTAPRESEWAKRIRACWQQSLHSILETGRLLQQAKLALEHGDWTAMVECELPFDIRTAQRLMAIAADPRLTNAAHAPLLPPHWMTLYELHRLDDETFQAHLADGTIHADMERRNISTAAKQARRSQRERELGTKQQQLPLKKYGLILADPEWRFEPWSCKTGMDRAADNHYPTSCTNIIAARDVSSIAAEDCVLFLWATVPMLLQALQVVSAWGFTYRSHLIWKKDRIATGYWFRNAHELLLVGTKGNIPAPAMGTQWASVIEAPVTQHSAKPERFLEMIEQYFPTLPKIELNRRGPPREGWHAWGNEADEDDASRARAVQ
jgi:N6-adenosine-specific RNA methylase IME4